MLLAAVPLVGAIELVLHVKQTTVDVVPEKDWTSARDAVANEGSAPCGAGVSGSAVILSAGIGHSVPDAGSS